MTVRSSSENYFDSNSADFRLGEQGNAQGDRFDFDTKRKDVTYFDQQLWQESVPGFELETPKPDDKEETDETDASDEVRENTETEDADETNPEDSEPVKPNVRAEDTSLAGLTDLTPEKAAELVDLLQQYAEAKSAEKLDEALIKDLTTKLAEAGLSDPDKVLEAGPLMSFIAKLFDLPTTPETVEELMATLTMAGVELPEGFFDEALKENIGDLGEAVSNFGQLQEMQEQAKEKAEEEKKATKAYGKEDAGKILELLSDYKTAVDSANAEEKTRIESLLAKDYSIANPGALIDGHAGPQFIARMLGLEGFSNMKYEEIKAQLEAAGVELPGDMFTTKLGDNLDALQTVVGANKNDGKFTPELPYDMRQANEVAELMLDYVDATGKNGDKEEAEEIKAKLAELGVADPDARLNAAPDAKMIAQLIGMKEFATLSAEDIKTRTAELLPSLPKNFWESNLRDNVDSLGSLVSANERPSQEEGDA